VSLTTSGDTSPRSITAFARYPTSADIHYRRTITIPHTAATAIREHEATVVVHGVDYDGSGVYDDALGPSDLNSNLTGDSTAPALCGSLTPTASTAAALRSGHPRRCWSTPPR